MALESAFQGKLIKRLKFMFPGCVILKNDPNYLQGMLDIIILYNRRWAALEVKRSSTAPLQPNQQYYVDQLDEMSFAAIIYPENEEEVIRDLQHALQARRPARVSQR